MDKETRSAGIVKLIIWSVVALVLIGVLVSWSISTLNGGAPYGTFSLFGGYVYDDPDTYGVGNMEYSADKIENIDISWAAGNVELVIYDGNTFKVEEKGSFDEDDRMRSRALDGTLTVKFAKSGIRLFGYNVEKELTLYIPVSACERIKMLNVESASADVTVGRGTNENLIALSLDKLNIASASGNVTASFGRADDVSIETVSGDIVLKVGSLKDAEIGSVSGRIQLDAELERGTIEAVSGAIEIETFNSIPQELEVESVSGNISLKLPESMDGFKAELDSVSGKMTCNGERGRHYRYGDGKADYSFETVSGNVEITVKKK